MKIRKSVMFMIAINAALVGTPLDSAVTRERPGGYLLNMYHFNIQYVVGDEDSMRRIVKQSFEPLVDFYLEHPGWGADFEMQGLMIEYMAKSYPDVLEKFKKLVNSGQAELVTFHYADQMLLAFPRHDQEWSLKLNDKLLEKHGVERSGVIFTQEAQFGEGFGVIGPESGYHAAVMTTSQYVWFQDDERFPYFTVNGMDVITNRDAVEPRTGIKVKWQFLGDGELVATAGISPYFPGLFRKNPVRLKLLEKQLEAAQADGYKVATVTEYVEALRAAGVEPRPLRPILDAPWRPEDGSGLFQWMGKYSLRREKDYDMRTKNWQVRNALIEAERAGADEEILEEAWSYMINAEVTDPSGWYPFKVEIEWDYEMMDKVIETLRRDENLDLAAAEERAGKRPALGKVVNEGPGDIKLYGNATGAKITWTELAEVPGAYQVAIEWTGKGDGGVAFPFSAKYLEYSPAMMEDTTVKVFRKDIKGKTIHLGLPNGLIGQADGPYIVRDNAAGTVAAGIDWKNREVRFEVKDGKEEVYRFKFYVLEQADTKQALDFANTINRAAP
jgi:hypothetical protein